jgi:hypothetical protein
MKMFQFYNKKIFSFYSRFFCVCRYCFIMKIIDCVEEEKQTF